MNDYKEKDLIINCTANNFCGYPKMGDLIAILNIFEYIRYVNNNHTIKFYLPDQELFGYDYVKKFKKILEQITDYFSETPGIINLDGSYELWSFRENNGQYIKIANNEQILKKICIFPLIDANYDNQRNWPIKVFQEIIDEFSHEKYNNYEKIICCKTIPHNIDFKNFKISSDFNENIFHIFTCEYYIGGATGLSLFNSILEDSNNKKSIYYYNYDLHGTWESVFTAPFYIKNKGILNFFTSEGDIIKIPSNYLKNKDDLLYQINYSKIEYDEQYINERYNTYGNLCEYISYLRLGYIIGILNKIPDSILDVGYGNGAFLNVCKSIIPHCYGYDISNYKLSSDITVVPDWLNADVDVLTFFDSLEHFDDPYILKNAKANNIVISVPWCHYKSDTWFLNWKHRRPNEHLWFFNEKSIYKFANRIGFRVINYTNLEDTIRKSSDEKNILTFTMARS